jgi:hypothetical protein
VYCRLMLGGFRQVQVNQGTSRYIRVWYGISRKARGVLRSCPEGHVGVSFAMTRHVIAGFGPSLFFVRDERRCESLFRSVRFGL